jgi:carboxyl-terminal processing protease
LTPAQRQRIFQQVWGAVEHWYPYFPEKGIDWQQVRKDYRRKVSAVSDDQAFYDLLSDMLCTLRDGHTQAMSYPDTSPAQGMPALRLVEVEGGRVAVASVQPGSPAERAGVQAGMVLATVDGIPVEECIRQLVPQITASTPAFARAMAISYLLHGPLSEGVTVGWADGTLLRLDRQPYDPFIRGSVVTSKRLPGNIGYVCIPSWQHALPVVAQVDQALAELKDTRALIIDTRGNSGGDDHLAAKVAGRFVRTPTAFTSRVFKYHLAGITGKSPRLAHIVHPRGPWRYDKPVVILTDPFVFSSAEFFVAGMKDCGRAVIIGQTTAGASGNPREFRAGAFHYRVSTWREHRRDGSLIEGHGITPTIPVVLRLDDLRKGTDVTLQTAREYLARTMGEGISSAP